MAIIFLAMAAALGVSSFACGMIPLSATYSRKYLDIMNALAMGLLLGTALGVIIPEGIEALVDYYKDSEYLPTIIAIDLIFGFLLMMVVEHFSSNGVHSHGGNNHSNNSSVPYTPAYSQPNGNTQLDFDAELDELESDQSGRTRSVEISRSTSNGPFNASAKQIAIPFTFGLIIHGLADGCALGVSAMDETSTEGTTNLSLIVFFALLFHKAPTSVAFAVSLLNTNLPRADCKKYLAIFAASTPIGAILTYSLLSFFGITDNTNIGSALLISGGTFLYVATVLQPVSQHEADSQDLASKWRLVLVVSGTLAPLLMSSLIGHGHGH